MEMNRLQVNRYYLKMDARARIARSKPNALVVGMILVAAYLLLEMLIPGVLGLSNIPIELPEQITSYDAYMAAMEKVSEQMEAFLRAYRPSAIAVVIAAALLLMHKLLEIGYSIYALHISRDEKAEYENLLDAFPIFGRLFVLLLMQWAIILVFSALLIVPGLIFAYRYRQAIYLLVEHPEYSPVRCLKESGRIMRGHKAELFMVDLSFLGWILAQNLLPVVSVLIAMWVIPYRSITYSNYYCCVAGPRKTPDGKPITDASFTDLPDA